MAQPLRTMAARSARAVYSAPVASSSRSFVTSVPSLAAVSEQASQAPKRKSKDKETVATTTAQSAPMTVLDWVPPQFPVRKPVPRTHGIHVATLTLYAHYPDDLEYFAEFAWQSANSLRIPASRPARLKKHRELVTVIKSPFVFKKSQENFERRHLRRSIQVYDTNRDVLDLWLRYLQKNSIGGIGMRVKVHEWVKVGFGQQEIDEFESALNDPKQAQQNIEEVAASLLKDLQKEGPEAAETEAKAAAKAEKKTKTKA